WYCAIGHIDQSKPVFCYGRVIFLFVTKADGESSDTCRDTGLRSVDSESPDIDPCQPYVVRMLKLFVRVLATLKATEETFFREFGAAASHRSVHVTFPSVF